jgi:hypothetical protein
VQSVSPIEEGLTDLLLDEPIEMQESGHVQPSEE